MDVKHIAFDIAFRNKRSPLDYEKLTDEQLIVKIKSSLPNASEKECLDAITKVRQLCNDVYEICDAYRDGKFGKDASAAKAAIIELSKKNPGFLASEYDTAFTTGLLWTAF
ncbi:MAG: hypothetical protein NTY22_00985 [Proteobacteria bacterium]|nr:hypothetical protein [Pseudomonadota bacterium]